MHLERSQLRHVRPDVTMIAEIAVNRFPNLFEIGPTLDAVGLDSGIRPARQDEPDRNAHDAQSSDQFDTRDRASIQLSIGTFVQSLIPAANRSCTQTGSLSPHHGLEALTICGESTQRVEMAVLWP